MESKKSSETKDKFRRPLGDGSRNQSALYCWALARISLGFLFLWAFLDKLFGLGFATCRNVQTGVVTVSCQDAWVRGGSPAASFLKFATKGPLAGFYQSLAGNDFVDILFMAALGLIGLALIAGIGIRIATTSGIVLVLMMWSAALPPKNNPLIDEHIIYAIVLAGILSSNSQQKWGLGRFWLSLPLVKKYKFLE